MLRSNCIFAIALMGSFISFKFVHLESFIRNCISALPQLIAEVRTTTKIAEVQFWTFTI
jgi:hypothetical protein